MIFADKVIQLRKKNGWSQETLAEKLNVSRQTVSKWESAQSVPDFNRMIQLSELFEVSTDYLLKDSIEEAEYCPSPEIAEEERLHTVSLETAGQFLSGAYHSAQRIALGVFLCILSPIPLIVLAGLQEQGSISLSEQQALGIGLLALILTICGAVVLFVLQYLRMHSFEYLEHNWLETEYGVDGMVKDRKEKYREQHNRLLVFGIALCVLSVVPIFLSMILGDDASMQIVAVPMLLICVAIGSAMLIKAIMVWSSFDILLETGDYTRTNKREEKRNEAFSGIYWGIVLTLYLGYSFLTFKWGSSWIIWPVAAVFYSVVCSVLKILRK